MSHHDAAQHEHDGDCAHEHALPVPGERRTAAALQVAFLLLAAAVVALPVVRPESRQWVGGLAINFFSIIIEAFPFMMLGALVGGVIEVFVSREWLSDKLEGRGVLAVLLAAGAGIVFPVCECAIVPVVRRLLRKGVPIGAAVAYLLAAPIANPVVAASTAVAYRFDWRFVATRMLAGYGVAVAVGFLVGAFFNRATGLAKGVQWDAPGFCGAHGDGSPRLPARLFAAVGHAADDFFDVARFLVIGAFIAALARTSVSVSTFQALASAPWLAILLMMALAVALNLCSEADAFIAASFRKVLPGSAQMAFMVLGPMLDIKLVLLHMSIFRKRVIALLVVAMVVGVFVLMLALEYWLRLLPGAAL